MKVLRLSSLSNCNSSLLESHPPLSLNLVGPSHPFPVFEFGVSKSPIPVFEFDVCLSFKNNSREAITGKSALQAPQQKGWEGQQYKCFMQIRPRPPTRPHIDRCSRPTKPIRFASSPPDCLFTEGTCSSFGIPDKNREIPSLSLLICFLDQLPLLFAHPDRK